MGKIKSAIITALLAAVIVVLAVFSIFSWQVPGSNGVKKYNSFINNVHLGGDLTGNATAILYPEGVISAAEYEFGIPERSDSFTEEELEEYTKEYNNYVNKYTNYGSIYVEKEVIDDNGGVDGLMETVANDAKVLSNRLNKKGYSSYSVSVLDEFTIMVSVPTGFTYAEYQNDEWTASSRSDKTAVIERTIEYLAYNGGLSLRNSVVGKAKYDNIITPVKVDVNTYFKSASQYSVGGTDAVKLTLTKLGREELKPISEKVVECEDDHAIGFYVGDYQLLSLTLNGSIDSRSFYITVSTSTSKLDAQNYAIVLDSVVNGDTIKLDYNSSDIQVVYTGAELGDNAALFLGLAILLILVIAIVGSIIKYKKLGAVQSIMIIMFALTFVVALMLLEIELTIAGLITAVLGLALMCGSNYYLFENVRKETLKGKTIQSSVKDGYKQSLFGILELHIILLIVSILLIFVGFGEISTIGLILFISTVASYVLYWFTRFMWYVISSLGKDKFKFCGFKREELEDD